MKKTPEYQKSAVALKKLGLIDFSIKTLSPSQKGTITKLKEKYKAVLKNPNNFVKRNISPATKIIAEKSGYLTSKKSVFLPVQGAQKVSIRKNKITYVRDNKKEEVYLIGDIKKFYRKASELQKGLKKNQLVTFKFGDKAASSIAFNSLEDLKSYLVNTLQPKFENENMFGKISLVTLERPSELGKRKENTTERKNRETKEKAARRKLK
jgi:hypothetical protein